MMCLLPFLKNLNSRNTAACPRHPSRMLYSARKLSGQVLVAAECNRRLLRAGQLHRIQHHQHQQRQQRFFSKKARIIAPPDWKQFMGESVQPPAGRLFVPNQQAGQTEHSGDDYIPQVPLHEMDGRRKKRVLILCTGGTLTMAPDPRQGGALAPVQGALSEYLEKMQQEELQDENMPQVMLHEYSPFVDSSDLGPADWARLALDISANYYDFDGFVVVTGTDTMAYVATALSFMLENLAKPVVFTGSQIPLCEPYNDGRRNLIMALIFASRDPPMTEVTIFFHDRLLRACRTTKVHTHKLLAFDSPNQEPLATLGINIDQKDHLLLPPAKGALRVHTQMDTRLLTLRLVPGFDDCMLTELVRHRLVQDQESDASNITSDATSAASCSRLRAIVLQLYGTGNLPSVKHSLIQLLADATEQGILVVASTQCHTGTVLLGHYAVGRALLTAGVVSAHDMTLEAIACKVAYLSGRGDLSPSQVGRLMGVSLRGEVTSSDSLGPPPLSSAFHRGLRQGQRYY